MTDSTVTDSSRATSAPSPSFRSAAAALLLLVPAPSLGVLTAMFLMPGTPLGQAIFVLCKAWLFALPLVWHLGIDRQRVGFSPARHGGFAMGAASGIVISLAIVAGYWALGGAVLEAQMIREKVMAMGLEEPWVFALGAAYWILINSVLEEYVWRWFCLSRLRRLMPGPIAVPVAAGLFTLHHVIVLTAYCGSMGVVVCSAGVFVGGTLWGWMVLRYGSIWPAYLSHAIVDVAVFGVGAWMIFG